MTARAEYERKAELVGSPELQDKLQAVPPRTAYRPEIDGLRAIAVMVVMGFHAGWPGFAGGYVGVDIFFVISGFVITQQLRSLFDSGRFSFADFFERRARRLMPALLAVLVVTSLASALVMTPSDLESYSKELLAVLSFTPNIYFWRTADYFGPSADFSLLLHTWSLGLEEQFYFLFPLLLLPAWRRSAGMARHVVFITAATSFALATWGVNYHPAATFYLLPTRAWELLLGASVAMAAKDASAGARRPIPGLGAPIGIAFILLAVGYYDPKMEFPGPAALLPTVGAALILWDTNSSDRVRRSLAWPPLVGVGLISYGAYLWHQPVLALQRYVSENPPSIWATTCALALSFLLASISWRWIEQPIRRAHRQSRASLLVCVPVASLLAAASFWAMVTNGLPARWGSSSLQILALGERPYKDGYREGRCFLRSNQPPADHLLGCADANVSGGTALWGDSHAAALSQGMRLLHAEQFRQYTASGCPPVAIAYSGLSNNCHAFSEAVWKSLRERPPKKLLIHARWSHYTLSAQGENSFISALEALRRDLPATSISVIGPVPQWHPSLPMKLARGRQPWQQEIWGDDATSSSTANYTEALLNSASQTAGLTYVSVRAIACPTGPCRQVVGDHGREAPFAWDNAHLTDEGAKWLAHMIDSQVRMKRDQAR